MRMAHLESTWAASMERWRDGFSVVISTNQVRDFDVLIYTLILWWSSHQNLPHYFPTEAVVCQTLISYTASGRFILIYAKCRSNSKFHQISKVKSKSILITQCLRNIFIISSSSNVRELGIRRIESPIHAFTIQKVQGKQVNVKEESITTAICWNNNQEVWLRILPRLQCNYVVTRNSQHESGLLPFFQKI